MLLERLRRNGPVRVVTIYSNAHAMGRIDVDDLQGERKYPGSRAQDQSKLANVLHPGVVRTSFGAEDPGRTQRLLVRSSGHS